MSDSTRLTTTFDSHSIKEIQKYVAECDICQRNKSENIPTPSLLHPLHIPNQKWEEISMDFIEGLLASDIKDKIFVLVDKLTKYAHFMAIKNTDTTKQIADTFCKNVYKLHGFPKVIVNDRDARFKGNFLEGFLPTSGDIPQHEFGLSPSDKWPN